MLLKLKPTYESDKKRVVAISSRAKEKVSEAACLAGSKTCGCSETKLILTKGQKSLSKLHSFNYNKIRILLTKSLVFSRVSAILGVKNDLKGICSFKVI